MTPTEHGELAARLSALADEPAPPPGFDVTASITRGRARRRIRRAGAVVAVSAATALVVGLATLLHPGNGNAAPTAPAASGTAAATPAPLPTGPAVDGTPLLTSELKVGWLPDWVDRDHGLGYASGSFGSNITAYEPKLAMRRLQIVLLAPGPEPALNRHPDEAKVPAEPINGRTAYWVEHPTEPRYDTSTRVLRWQAADGRWAQITAMHYAQTPIPDADLVRIAESVTSTSRDVPLPFWLSGLPASVRPDEASLTHPTGTPVWESTLGLKVGDKVVSVAVAPEDSKLMGLRPESKCRHEAGLQICATALPEILPLLDQVGGLTGLLDRVHVTGPDESTWTTSNLR
ncbi:hypothetical protein ACFV1W_33880 [Kitasatospora sp. NPDC059648]|uniref:hypothetical protein n=1 Tax=Kitasatospora sp. NPDC059648 TaxID=3346894 RepID=UPI003694924C